MITKNTLRNARAEPVPRSVVVLFILELDEYCHCTLSTFAPTKAVKWQLKHKIDSDSDTDGHDREEYAEKCMSGACSPPFTLNDALVGDVASLQKEVKALRNTISHLL
jgi:hypothetical protein